MSAKEDQLIEGVTRRSRPVLATASLFVVAALALVGVAVGFLATARQIGHGLPSEAPPAAVSSH